MQQYLGNLLLFFNLFVNCKFWKNFYRLASNSAHISDTSSLEYVHIAIQSLALHLCIIVLGYRSEYSWKLFQISNRYCPQKWLWITKISSQQIQTNCTQNSTSFYLDSQNDHSPCNTTWHQEKCDSMEVRVERNNTLRHLWLNRVHLQILQKHTNMWTYC